MKLSVIVPSIRPQNLKHLYISCLQSFSDKFEFIVVGPFMPDFDAEGLYFIESFRSPNASQQQGLTFAKGEYITFAADDGVFLPEALDKAIKHMEICEDFGIVHNACLKASGKNEINKNYIIVGKYLEGDNPNPDMLKEDYYKFGYHKAYRLKGVPQDAFVINAGIISRKFMLELGGFDAKNFDVTTFGHADFSIRAHNAGAKTILMDEVLFKCSHLPNRTGDHFAVHNSQIKHDMPIFKKMYSKPNNRTVIDINNWKETSEKWVSRFGK